MFFVTSPLSAAERTLSSQLLTNKIFIYTYVSYDELKFHQRDSVVLAVSVCLSVCHESAFCQKVWTDRAGFFA